MEILTLLKSNIRHRKGSFVSVILLMIIISMSLTAIISVNDNAKSGIENAVNQVNAGNLNIYISESKLTDELFNNVKNHETVEDAVAYPAIATNKITVKENSDTNTCFLQKLRPEYQLFNENLSGYAKEIPRLKTGEIYISQGMCTRFKCTLGDIITMDIMNRSIDFTIKGIIVEPVNGSSVMGCKQVFISDEDFDTIYDDNAKAGEGEELNCNFRVLKIIKSESCTLSDGQFKRQLNLDTKVTDNGVGSVTKEQAVYYTNLYSHIIGSVLLVFTGFLMIVVLIVMGHSISVSIEMEYVNLGILKSQGFSKNKIRLVFILQSLIAQIIGILLGTMLAVTLIGPLGDAFQPITGILTDKHISLLSSLLILVGVLIVSAGFTAFITRKVGRISPVRAISGGRGEIYFDSRLKAPISKKALSASLALRQFTSNKRQYIGLILIVAILVFFMMTVMVLGNIMNSKTALKSMGIAYTDLNLTFSENADDKTIDDIEHIIENKTEITDKYYMSSKYLSVDGQELHCTIYKNPEAITSVLKGRAPIYDNEIIITEIAAEELNLKMGDKVTVSNGNKSGEYLISGYYQFMNDGGLCFAFSSEGAEKLDVECLWDFSYTLADSSKGEVLAKKLNEKYGGILDAASVTEDNDGDDMYALAINVMKAVIYMFSVIFALVVVHMVCSKAFLREKTEIGIYKSFGFLSHNLRIQFAIRFFIVAVIGSIVGTALSFLFSGKLLSTLLRSIGISDFSVRFTQETFLFPIILVCVCFFVFAYLVSRKIKNIAVRELVAE